MYFEFNTSGLSHPLTDLIIEDCTGNALEKITMRISRRKKITLLKKCKIFFSYVNALMWLSEIALCLFFRLKKGGDV